MSWSTITAAEVLQEFTPAEKATLDNIQASAQGESNLSGILTRTVNKFRGAIRAGGQTLSTTDGEIPDDVRDNVIAHARWTFLISFPQLKVMQTVERKEAFNEALKTLEALRQPGKFNVESPTDDTSDPTVRPAFGTRGGSASNDPREREFTRDKQEGI